MIFDFLYYALRLTYKLNSIIAKKKKNSRKFKIVITVKHSIRLHFGLKSLKLYHHLSNEAEMIINGFDSAGITEAVNDANSVLEIVENPFRSM